MGYIQEAEIIGVNIVFTTLSTEFFLPFTIHLISRNSMVGWGESNLSVLFLWWFLFTYDFSSFFCVFNQYYLIFCSLLYLFVNSYLICNQVAEWSQLVGADSVHLFPTWHPECSHIASLKSGMVRIFMSWKLANAICEWFIFRVLIYQ